MKKPINFMGLIGMNSIIVENELLGHKFELESTQNNGDYTYRVYKSTPFVYHVNVKYRNEKTGLFAESFIIY